MHVSRNNEHRPGTCVLHVRDAARLWQRPRDDDLTGLHRLEQHDGVATFTVIDPDGNTMRYVSPGIPGDQ